MLLAWDVLCAGKDTPQMWSSEGLDSKVGGLQCGEMTKNDCPGCTRPRPKDGAAFAEVGSGVARLPGRGVGVARSGVGVGSRGFPGLYSISILH